jgi:CheY-like chemotaxis protein
MDEHSIISVVVAFSPSGPHVFRESVPEARRVDNIIIQCEESFEFRIMDESIAQRSLVEKKRYPPTETNETMQKPRILIVDDEPGLVRLLTLNLEKMDRYEILTVEDPALVLEAVVNFRPALVILDWIMPRITGGEVAEEIRADPRVCDTPILFFSAFIMKRDGQEISGFPAIAKPIGMHDLVEAIDEHLSKCE